MKTFDSYRYSLCQFYSPLTKYRIYPKYSNKQAWANSVDPDQKPRFRGFWSGSSLFAIPPVYVLDLAEVSKTD